MHEPHHSHATIYIHHYIRQGSFVHTHFKFQKGKGLVDHGHIRVDLAHIHARDHNLSNIELKKFIHNVELNPTCEKTCDPPIAHSCLSFVFGI